MSIDTSVLRREEARLRPYAKLRSLSIHVQVRLVYGAIVGRVEEFEL